MSGLEHVLPGTLATRRAILGVVLLATLSLILSLYYLRDAEDSRTRALLSLHAQADTQTDRYLVHGRKCHIQDVDPYDEEVRAFIKAESHIACSKLPPLTTFVRRDAEQSELRIESGALRAYSPGGVSCCYSVVTRPSRDIKPDDSVHVSECHDLLGTSLNTSAEFIIVRCNTRHRRKEVYRDAHAAVHVSAEVRSRLEAARRSRLAAGRRRDPLSVLIVGVDSVSRLNALRALPQTVSTLRRRGWIELLGYNKIADNTYPNLMALLTGIDGERSYEECLPTQPGRLDACPLLWHRFRELGYATAYAEDEPDISTFNFLKAGFVQPPTDHYLRPFLLAAQRELRTTERHSLKYCLGPLSAGERVLRYAEEFAAAYVNHTSFGLFWTNSFSHNDLNSPSGMDGVLASFFRRVHESGAAERSLILFMSDHGMRFGDMRQTKVGWLEERLPLAWVSVPRWFRRRHAPQWAALRTNAARLTTPYDLHLTLRHVLTLDGGGEPEGGAPGCRRCHSLFRPLDADRSCEDAAISPHWCVCTAFREVDASSAEVRAAAAFVVTRVTAYVREGQTAAAEEAARKCATLSLGRVLLAQRGASWDGLQVYYLLFVETLPGRGRYEATVSLSANGTANPTVPAAFRLHSSISRLDQYAGQSRCINNAFLRKYCYCR